MKKPITFLSVLLLFTFGAAAQPSGLVYELDTLFRGWHDREQLSGELLVARNDTILYQQALGFSDPMTANAAQTRNAV
ncbi:MAG: hypothetical protein IPK21_14790 [Haliscomenobacter sp.]|nr:hypothetical protein [Haliscomenobacter sp.]